MKTKYGNRNHKGRYMTARYTIHSVIGLAFLIILTLLLALATFQNWYNHQPLISPVAGVVEASEPSVTPTPDPRTHGVVRCDEPKGYLECLAHQKKITWAEYDKIYNIIQCESTWNPNATHVNKNGSIDMGLVQINSIHKDISNKDKFDYKKAIDWMINKYHKDGSFRAWVCNK